MWEDRTAEIEDLFRAHWPLVFRYLHRRTGDRAAAEDLAQETFLRATRALLGWRGGRPEAWLLTIAGNVFIDDARRRKVSLPLMEELLPSSAEENAATRVDVIEALRRLPPQQAQLLRLVHMYGFTHAEVAAMSGTSTEAIKTAAWRARRAFRATYGEDGDDDGAQ